jgi:hypothetical protein
MKFLIALLATAVAGLGLVAPVEAQQLPTPRYVKKAVFVRMHWDRTFYEYWYNKGLSTSMMNSMLRRYFDDARAAYLNSALHGIDLILLDDFNRATGPMSGVRDAGPPFDGNWRMIDAMRIKLRTGNVNKTVPNGTTYLLGRTINWVFVHGNFGGLGGQADSIRGLGNGEAHVFISTASGDLTVGGMYYPLVEQRPAFVLETILHETGHLFGGEHGYRNELADCPSRGPYELMCAGFTNLQRRFGTQNYSRVTNVMKGTLQRCNSAFTSVNSCENAVSNMCSNTGDYTQIQPCIDFNIGVSCRDICTSTQKSARVVINSLSPVIGGGVVDAPGPAN